MGIRPKKTLLQRNTDVQKYMERCSMPLIITKMQTKTAMRSSHMGQNGYHQKKIYEQ